MVSGTVECGQLVFLSFKLCILLIGDRSAISWNPQVGNSEVLGSPSCYRKSIFNSIVLSLGFTSEVTVLAPCVIFLYKSSYKQSIH